MPSTGPIGGYRQPAGPFADDAAVRTRSFARQVRRSRATGTRPSSPTRAFCRAFSRGQAGARRHRARRTPCPAGPTRCPGRDHPHHRRRLPGGRANGPARGLRAPPAEQAAGRARSQRDAQLAWLEPSRLAGDARLRPAGGDPPSGEHHPATPQKRGSRAVPPRVRWSVQEIRRLAGRLAPRRIEPAFASAWFVWRRCRQAVHNRPTSSEPWNGNARTRQQG
jgi:hypothetical protein